MMNFWERHLEGHVVLLLLGPPPPPEECDRDALRPIRTARSDIAANRRAGEGGAWSVGGNRCGEKKKKKRSDLENGENWEFLQLINRAASVFPLLKLRNFLNTYLNLKPLG